MNAQMTFLHALSPLQPGTGRGLGLIDLPIARESATGLPYLPGSTLKGVLRDLCDDEELCEKIFGSEVTAEEENLRAGAAQFSDQRLLLLPIRSLAGVFAWVTSPFVLKRLKREVALTQHSDCPADIPQPMIHDAGQNSEKIEISITSNSHLRLRGANIVVLEDLDLSPKADEAVDRWAEWLAEALFSGDAEWSKVLKGKLAVVPDELFAFFIETGMEIIARNRLDDDSKTVVKGGLWYEEALPTETILSGIISAQKIRKDGAEPEKIIQAVSELVHYAVQLGGNSTIGRGLCRMIINPASVKENES